MPCTVLPISVAAEPIWFCRTRPLRLSWSCVDDWSWPIWLICARSWSFFAGSIGSWFWSWVIIILMKSSGFSAVFLDDGSWFDEAGPCTGGVYMPVVSAGAVAGVQKSDAVISRAAGVARGKRGSCAKHGRLPIADCRLNARFNTSYSPQFEDPHPDPLPEYRAMESDSRSRPT